MWLKHPAKPGIIGAMKFDPLIPCCPILCSLLFAGVAHAGEPDDRGPRGWFVSGGPAISLGRAVDSEGRDAGSFTGAGGHFRFGEEVWPGLTMGLAFLGTGGTGNSDRYDAGLGGLLLQGSYRPVDSTPLVFVFGTGVGGGALTAKGAEKDEEEPIDGTAGGALFQLGVLWEFKITGGPTDGLSLAPAINWYMAPSTDSNKASVQTFTIGVDTTWYFGR